jgi:transcriptional regulator PpsR
MRARKSGQFDAPKRSLGDLEASLAGEVLACTSDLTLIIDDKGVIRDLAFASDELAQLVGDGWLGQPWVDTVNEDTRPKVTAILGEAGQGGVIRGRHLNQRLASGEDLAVQYTFARLPGVGRQAARLLAFGRDQRPTAALQQRLVEAQLSVERDYARFRQAELRYRHLFQVAAEAVLVVDAASGKVVEANPAAAALFEAAADKLVGVSFPVGMTPRSARAVQTLLATVRRSGRAEPVMAELAANRAEVRVSATLVHQDTTSLLLVRLTRGGDVHENAPSSQADGSMLLQLAQSSPDSLVVTDLDGRVLAANAEFLGLTQMANEDLLRGQSLDRWLGRSGVDLGVLVSNLRQGGSVKLFATTVCGEFGSITEVEISAVMVASADPAFLGFTIRDVGRRLTSEGEGLKGLPRSVNQLTELVGRVPLKEIVGETTDLIEKLCIEAALELTRDNRASAAEILGLSRQSLYVKLRRYGLGDLGAGADR